MKARDPHVTVWAEVLAKTRDKTAAKFSAGGRERGGPRDSRARDGSAHKEWHCPHLV